MLVELKTAEQDAGGIFSTKNTRRRKILRAAISGLCRDAATD